MAHPADQRTRRLAPSFSRTLLQWGVAAACVAFFWALASMASRVWPAAFEPRIRGPMAGTIYPTSFSLINPTVDWLILVACSASVLAILALRIRRLGRARMVALMLPALLIALFSLSPVVLLSIGALGTIAGILYLILHSSELLKISPARMLSSVLILLAASTAVVFSVSAARWVLDAYDGAPPLQGSTWSASMLVLKLMNQTNWWMPGLVLLLFLSWPLRLLLGVYWKDLRGYFARLSLRFMQAGSKSDDWLESKRLPPVLLVASLAGSLFVGAYPYLQAINPKPILVGLDVGTFYYHTLQHMLNQNPLSAVSYSLQNDRAVYLLFQYFLALLTGSAWLAIRIVPALLAVLLTVSTYFFVRAGVKDGLLAATAALFAAFSLLVVSGVNAGLYADWLAMSEALVFFSLLLVGLDRPDRRYVALSVAVSVLILFTHPWTWVMTLGVVAAYFLLTAARAFMVRDWKNHLRFELASVVTIFVVDFVVDEAKHLLGGLSGVQDAYSSTASTLTLANVPKVLSSLQLTLGNWLGGGLDCFLIFALAIVGVLTIPDLGSRMNRLLLSWMVVTSGGILLYGYSAAGFQARIILLAPLQILGAMGFLSLLRYLTPLMSAGGHENQRLVKAFVVLAYLTVFGAMLAFVLQNVGSLYT